MAGPSRTALARRRATCWSRRAPARESPSHTSCPPSRARSAGDAAHRRLHRDPRPAAPGVLQGPARSCSTRSSPRWATAPGVALFKGRGNYLCVHKIGGWLPGAGRRARHRARRAHVRLGARGGAPRRVGGRDGDGRPGRPRPRRFRARVGAGERRRARVPRSDVPRRVRVLRRARARDRAPGADRRHQPRGARDPGHDPRHPRAARRAHRRRGARARLAHHLVRHPRALRAPWSRSAARAARRHLRADRTCATRSRPRDGASNRRSTPRASAACATASRSRSRSRSRPRATPRGRSPGRSRPRATTRASRWRWRALTEIGDVCEELLGDGARLVVWLAPRRRRLRGERP